MKKLLIFILAFALVFSFAACSGLEDSEVLAEYGALYEKAREVNGIIYGTGLPYDGEYDVSTLTSPYYVEVSADSKYQTADGIKAAVLAVYTEDYYNDALANVLFNGLEDEYATVYPRYKMSDGKLMTDITYDVFESVTGASCDVNEAYVSKSTSGSAIIMAPYYRDGVRQTNDKKTTMLLTENGWRFDNLA